MKRYFVPVIFLVSFMVLLHACGDNKSTALWLPPPAGVVSMVTLTDFQSAGTVIGQPTFTSNAYHAAAANTVGSDYGNPAVLNNRLYLPDYENSRVLVFNSIPTGTNASADFAIGQADLVSAAQGSGASQLSRPQTVRAYDGKLFVDDWDNRRILIWNSAPTGTGAAADIVVGQPGFGSMISSCTRTGLAGAEDFIVASGRLIVSDTMNSRVLIWNVIPMSHGTPADIVLGQNSFTRCVANDDLQTGMTGTPSARTLAYPTGLWSDGTRLVVSDYSNNRVLIWNSFPTANFTPADHVLGQSDFSHATGNDDLQTRVSGTPSARTFNNPYFLDSNGVQLFVVDEGNNRILVWNSFPTADFTPADRVLGQSDFSHRMDNDDNQDGTADANPTARTLNNPWGIYVYGTKLFVTDGGNNRFLVFDSQ